MGRVNRCIELLGQGQPIYWAEPQERSFAGGIQAAQTWNDFVYYDMEHEPYDIPQLREFMRGLVQGGPTRSGHRTPTVLVALPLSGTDEPVVRANAWMVNQALATGIHGLLLCHAESPTAVKAFIEAARYPFQRAGVGEGLDEGRRGNGGQATAAGVWGLPIDGYLERADVWPLNPYGEILIGVKIENKRALANVEASTCVPGVGFAEWGPGDMGMSLGFPNKHYEPYPPQMLQARERVFAACKAAGIAFSEFVAPGNVVQRINEGVMIGGGPEVREAAEVGRRRMKRSMPW